MELKPFWNRVLLAKIYGNTLLLLCKAVSYEFTSKHVSALLPYKPYKCFPGIPKANYKIKIASPRLADDCCEAVISTSSRF